MADIGRPGGEEGDVLSAWSEIVTEEVEEEEDLALFRGTVNKLHDIGQRGGATPLFKRIIRPVCIGRQDPLGVQCYNLHLCLSLSFPSSRLTPCRHFPLKLACSLLTQPLNLLIKLPYSTSQSSAIVEYLSSYEELNLHLCLSLSFPSSRLTPCRHAGL